MKATRFALFTVMVLIALMVVLGPTTTPPVQAAPKSTRLVSPSGTNSGDCSVSACKTITYALTQAGAGDTINLAAGTYSVANGETLPLVPTVDVVISGAGATTTIIDGGNTQRVMTVNSGRNITLQNLTITKGNNTTLACWYLSIYDGGGVCNMGTLTVSNSTFSNNSATSSGGGIFNYNGTVTVANSTFSGNNASSTSGGGGGICSSGSLTISNSTFAGNSASAGGGIKNNGTLTVDNSTFSGNSATDTGGGLWNEGGATVINNSTFAGNSASYGGGIDNPSMMTVNNSTFAGNSASQLGGGIHNINSLTVNNSTFAGNSASFGGGGIYNNYMLNYANTIVANSTSGGDCVNEDTIATNTNNLVQDGSCSAALSGDPKLDPAGLKNNGGATQTIALQSNSPAIDRGNATTCADVATVNGLDQRGQSRNDLKCDIGAYEMQMSDRNNTSLTPSTSSMTTYGPPRVGIQDNGSTHPGVVTATKVANWTGGTPANTIGAWWELSAGTNNTGLNLGLQLCYSTAEVGNLNESGAHFWRYSGGTWLDAGAVASFDGTTPNRCAHISGISALSRWTLSNASGPGGNTPSAVTLSSFNAKPGFDLVAWFRQILGH